MRTKLLSLFAAVLCCSAALAQSPKDTTVYVIGHAHMDMDWLWPYAETMKMANDNLRQAVAFMKEYPDYTMLQSQPAVYKFVEETDPALFAEVQKYAAEGRLEPVGGTWTESDQNLSSGEALARSFMLGQRYFKDKLGRTARVGWFPDDFGHLSQLPQMLNLAGINYFYCMRCSPFRGSFLWQGSDGSEVIVHNSETYNGHIEGGFLRRMLREYPGAGSTTLCPTGEGDHGGGPTRAWIEEAHKLDADPSFPAVKFTPVEEFFKAAEAHRDELPVHKGEMQFVFEGCYTNVAEIKEMNRRCEESLYEGEMLNSVWWLAGGEYPACEYKHIWEEVVFNEFHDIIPGSAIFESNRESVARYTEALRKSDVLRDKAFLSYVDRIPFRADQGQPIVAFNLQPYGRKALVEADVFSYDEPATASLTFWGNYYGAKNVVPKDGVASILVRDENGKAYPAQIIEGKKFPPGYRSRVMFLVDEMPAGGYKTFYVDATSAGDLVEPVPFEDNVFDTDFYKIRIDPATGDIVSLIVKETGREYVKEGGRLNTLRIYNERPDGHMKSWTINEATSIEDVTRVEGPVKIINGPVRATIESVRTWGRSRFIVRTYIYKSYPRVDFDLSVDWLDVADKNGSPMLRAVFPLQMEAPRLWCNVPFDVVERPAEGKINGVETGITNPQSPVTAERRYGQEVPAQKWAYVSGNDAGLALMSRSKYGYSYYDGEFRLTLLRTGGDPDRYPNLGIFNIEYSIRPDGGDWKENAIIEGECYSTPVYAHEPLSLSTRKGPFNRPTEKSLISLDKKNVLLTGIKRGEDGKQLVVRLAEVAGEETTVALTLPSRVKAFRKLNFMEWSVDGAKPVKVKGNTVEVTLKPHEIATLGIKCRRR